MPPIGSTCAGTHGASPARIFFTMTIFDRIINGGIPCHKVHEDERVLAFLDIAPLSRGHTLLIPKEAARTLDELSDESAAAIGAVLPRLCRAIMRATGAEAYNVLQNNGKAAHQEVQHVHFHIIPRRPGEPHAGLGVTWQPGSLEEGEETAARIAAAMGEL